MPANPAESCFVLRKATGDRVARRIVEKELRLHTQHSFAMSFSMKGQEVLDCLELMGYPRPNDESLTSASERINKMLKQLLPYGHELVFTFNDRLGKSLDKAIQWNEDAPVHFSLTVIYKL